MCTQEILQKKNNIKFERLQKTHKGIEEKMNLMADIMFANFEITSSNIEMLKSYVDEYYDRFLVIEKSLSVILRNIEGLNEVIDSKEPG